MTTLGANVIVGGDAVVLGMSENSRVGAWTGTPLFIVLVSRLMRAGASVFERMLVGPAVGSPVGASVTGAFVGCAVGTFVIGALVG